MEPTDAQLIERFLEKKDETAFEALTQRHGSIVLGICKRMLRNMHDAEDAAQELGIDHSTLRGRLGQARDLLKDRLVRRGVTLASDTVLATLLSKNASAAEWITASPLSKEMKEKLLRKNEPE